MSSLLGPIPRADHRTIAGVEIDIVRVGSGRVGRVVYPPGFRWSKDMVQFDAEGDTASRFGLDDGHRHPGKA